jgi:hypothetical protein
MNTSLTTRFTGLVVAMLITVGIQGSMLWTFDAVAHDGQMACTTDSTHPVAQESGQAVVPQQS